MISCPFCQLRENYPIACDYNPKKNIVLFKGNGFKKKIYKIGDCKDHQIILDRAIWHWFPKLHPNAYKKLDMFFPLMGLDIVPYTLNSKTSLLRK